MLNPKERDPSEQNVMYGLPANPFLPHRPKKFYMNDQGRGQPGRSAGLGFPNDRSFFLYFERTLFRFLNRLPWIVTRLKFPHVGYL